MTTNPPVVSVDPDSLADLTWRRMFGNDRPTEIEIGTGKAGFLLERARTYPDRNFLGIEWASEFSRYACDRMRRWNITNVRMLRADAAEFMTRHCPRDSLTTLHVYHPDPWPKRRHHKRRLIQIPFVDVVADCLQSGGHWAVQTDHAEYFAQIRPLLVHHPAFEEVPFDDPQLNVATGEVATNYQMKYEREGRPIYNVAVRRR